MLGTKKLSTKVNQSNSNICEKIATSVLAETDKKYKIKSPKNTKYRLVQCAICESNFSDFFTNQTKI